LGRLPGSHPAMPWQYLYGRRKRPLTEPQMDERANWARHLLREGFGPAWFVHSIIWADISSKGIPGTPQKAFQQRQAGASKRRRLMSIDAAGESRHLAGTTPAWVANGGVLSAPLAPAEEVPAPPAAPVVARHKLLDASYVLKSKAFMLTYHSRAWTRATWARFETWLRRVRRELGARAWAGCLEVTPRSRGSTSTADASGP